MEECLSYFSGKRVYRLLFEKLRDKYISLGHLGGSVTLTSLTMEEKEQLGGFLQKNYRGNKTVTVSAAALSKALDNSRFAGLSWISILEEYFSEPLIGKQEAKNREQNIKTDFFRTAVCSYRQSWEQAKGREYPMGEGTAVSWLETVLEKQETGHRQLMQAYKENRDELKSCLAAVLKAADSLPAYEKNWERLPIFAARITGNPHGFDEGTLSGRLLELFIIYHFQLEKENGISGAEWKERILYQAGILKDALSNMTTAYNIHGSAEGVMHEGIEGFFRMKEPVCLTLHTLKKLDDLWADQGGVVYVLENPAVFSALIERYPDISAVCSNGQPRLATLILLDRLSSRSILKYAGDFDPEGLVIAQNMKKRYKDRLEYWCYDKDCSLACSDVRLSEERLNMLERIQDFGLLIQKETVMKYQRAIYQENILDVYVEELDRDSHS